MAKRIIDPALRLALAASGVPDAELSETPAPEAPEPEVPAPEPEVEAPEAEAPAPTALNPDLIAKLMEASAATAKLEVQLQQAVDKLATLEAQGATARSIVLTATSRLAVALSSTVVGLESASTEVLCSHFLELNKKFEERYPAAMVSRAGSNVVPDDKDEIERQRRVAQAGKRK